jgi:Lon protease-like protein
MHAYNPLLEGFNGIARLFPLPNLVLFPYVVQPLHIFEPRYRQLMADSLAGDRLIAMALLQPDWEEAYAENPPIYPVVCLGKILQEQQLPDGRYNLLLHGVSRARIQEELPSDRLYRTARVEILDEVEGKAGGQEHALKALLGESIKQWLSQQTPVLEQLRQLLESTIPLGTLCDIFGFALNLDVAIKQQLLEEIDVYARVHLLLDYLKTIPGLGPPSSGRKFPPDFSVN